MSAAHSIPGTPGVPGGPGHPAWPADPPDAGRWMVGIFRQLVHWVPAGARRYDTEHGTVFYSACRSPCLRAPFGRYVFWTWPACPECGRHADVPPPAAADPVPGR